MIWSLSWLTKDYPPIFHNVKFDSLWAAFKLWVWFRWHGQWARLARIKGRSKEELIKRAEKGGAS